MMEQAVWYLRGACLPVPLDREVGSSNSTRDIGFWEKLKI